MRLGAAILAVLALTATDAAAAARVVPKAAVPGATVELRGITAAKRITVGRKVARIVSTTRTGVRFVVPRVRRGRQAVRAGRARATLRVLPEFTGKVKVRLAGRRAERKTIGPAGGTVTTSRGRVTYTLAVPAGALAGDVRVTMTPVSRFTGLPLTRSAPAGVRLSPDGLVFAKPVTLTIAGLARPARYVGFTMTDAGRALTLLPAQVSGRKVAVSLEHFSTPGAGAPSEMDFVSMLANYIATTTPNLPLGQWMTIKQVKADAAGMYPGFCSNQTICAEFDSWALQALEAQINQQCQLQGTQPTVGGVMHILDIAIELQALGGTSGSWGCAGELLGALGTTAMAEVAARPFASSGTVDQLTAAAFVAADLDHNGTLSWLEWTVLLSRHAQRFASADVASNLTNAWTRALQKAIDDGLALCESDRTAGRLLLRQGAAIAFALAYLQDKYVEAMAACDITISVLPVEVTTTPGSTVEFAVAGNDESTVSWTTSGGTIAPNGTFTAPDAPGDYTVMARRELPPHHNAQAVVHVRCEGETEITESCTPTDLTLLSRSSTLDAHAVATSGGVTDLQSPPNRLFDEFGPWDEQLPATATAPNNTTAAADAQQDTTTELTSGVLSAGGYVQATAAVSYTQGVGTASAEGISELFSRFTVGPGGAQYTLTGSMQQMPEGYGDIVIEFRRFSPNPQVYYFLSDHAVTSVNQSGALTPGDYSFWLKAYAANSASGWANIALNVTG